MKQSKNSYGRFLPPIIHRLQYQAQKLALHPAMPCEEVEDWEQILIMTVLESLPRYNVQRAQLQTFLNCVVVSKVRMIIRNACRLKRGSENLRLMNLSEEISCEDASPSDLPWEEAIELRYDVEAILKSLPPDLMKMCRSLQCSEAIAAENGLSRSALYRRILKLRRIFSNRQLNNYFAPGRTSFSKRHIYRVRAQA